MELAIETVTPDLLSNGRVILSVGLGAIDSGFAAFGNVTDRKTGAELLDEGLDILTGLWRGQPFSYNGKHYQIKETTFLPPPPPIQQSRIPIWVVGAWPRAKSMQRVVRFDGLLPTVFNEHGQSQQVMPDDNQDMKALCNRSVPNQRLSTSSWKAKRMARTTPRQPRLRARGTMPA